MSNIAAIGYGYWGKNLIRNFYELGELHTVCDNDPSREEFIKKEYPGVDFITDYDTVLENPEISAVAISTPAVFHYKMVRSALLAGKDAFVEKPLALDVKEGEELVELAASQNRILMVGHILRYHPAILKLSELINSGALGRIQYIYSNRLNMGKIRTEENILWSFAPHDISVILALLNEEPNHVSCHGSAYLNKDVVDVTNTQLRFPSGVGAHIFVSWIHPFKEQRLVVIGSEKMAVFDDTAQDKLVVYPHRVEWKGRIPTAVKAEKETVPLEPSEPLKNEVSHFLECIKSRNPPVTNGPEGLRVLRVLDACEQAMKGNPESKKDSHSRNKNDQEDYFSHESAIVDSGCSIGSGTKIWHYSHIMKNAKIGKHCSFGQNCSIAPEVVIGNNVKVQNNVSIYSGTIIDDDVFLGPSCVLTNVTNPRSQVNRQSLYEKTHIRQGASIGANATIVCGITIGRYAFVGAGAVVTKDLPDYALVVGNPAKKIGWMSRHGHRLSQPDDTGVLTCPESGYRYQETKSGTLHCLDLDENEPLPNEQSKGTRSYDSYK